MAVRGRRWIRATRRSQAATRGGGYLADQAMRGSEGGAVMRPIRQPYIHTYGDGVWATLWRSLGGGVTSLGRTGAGTDHLGQHNTLNHRYASFHVRVELLDAVVSSAV